MRINECKFAKPTSAADQSDVDVFLGFDGVGMEDEEECLAYSDLYSWVLDDDYYDDDDWFFGGGGGYETSTEVKVLRVFSKLIPSLFLIVALYEFQTLFYIISESGLKLVGLLFAILAGLNAANFAFFVSKECKDVSEDGESICSLGPGSIMTIVGTVLLICDSVLAFQIHPNLDPEWEDSMPEERSSSSVAPDAHPKKKKKHDDRFLHEIKIKPGKIGITINKVHGHHTVIAIKENSHNKGLFHVGDHIKMVNGHDVSNRSNEELLEILSESAHEQRSIVVDREDVHATDV